MTAAIILCLASKRIAGGGHTTVSPCPPTGTTGATTLYAASAFDPQAYDGWPGGGSPDSSVGIENAYGPPDAISWTASVAPEPENPFDAAAGFGLDAYAPEYPACAQVITGGTIEIIFTDLSGAGGSLVGAALLIDDGDTGVYLGSTSGTGAQTITVPISAAWAQQIADGTSPGIVLNFYRDGAVPTVVSVDAIVVALDWQVT